MGSWVSACACSADEVVWAMGYWSCGGHGLAGETAARKAKRCELGPMRGCARASRVVCEIDACKTPPQEFNCGMVRPWGWCHVVDVRAWSWPQWRAAEARQALGRRGKG